MSNTTEKKALKIKLNNNEQFLQAWDAFLRLGYRWCCDQLGPRTAPYLFAYSDGRLLADYFDVEGADLSSPKSAFGHFTNHEHEEITIEGLLGLALNNPVYKKGDFVCFEHGLNKDVFKIELKPKIKSRILYITIMFEGHRREILEQNLRHATLEEREAGKRIDTAEIAS